MNDSLHFTNKTFLVFCSGHTLASLRQKEPFDETLSRDFTQPQSPKIDVKFEENKSSFVTDLPFVDILITPSALMLPLMRIEPKPMPVDRNDDGPHVVSLYGMQLYCDEICVQFYWYDTLQYHSHP